MNEKDKDFDPNFLEFLKRENLLEKYENTHLTNRRFVDFLRKRTDISDKLKQNKIHDFLKYGEQDMPDVKLFLNGKVKQGTKLGIDRDYTFDERQQDIEENTVERVAEYIEKYRGKISRKEYAITEREFTERKLKDAKGMEYFQYVLCLKHYIKTIDEYLDQLEQQDIDKNDRNFDPNFLEFLKNRKGISEKYRQVKINDYLKYGTMLYEDVELYHAENNLPIKKGEAIGKDRDYTFDEVDKRLEKYTLEYFANLVKNYRKTLSQKQFAAQQRDIKIKRMERMSVLGFANTCLLLQHQINIIDEYLKQLEQTDNGNGADDNNTPKFSAIEWATIFYYANNAKLISGKTINEKIENFMSANDIGTTHENIRTKYYEAQRRINKKNDYPISKLNSLIPFLQEHYPESVTFLENDKDYLESENTENQ